MPPTARSRTRTARSRSRTQQPSSSRREAQYVHPLAFTAQPQGVQLANSWVALHREFWALRITIKVLNLVLAAVYHLPVHYSSAIRDRITLATWPRDRTFNNGQEHDIIHDGTAFLRHGRHPVPQLLWLLLDLPRHVWNIRTYQRVPLLNAANAMVEYLLTYMYLQQDYHVGGNIISLDVPFLEVFMQTILTIGADLYNQYISALRLITAAPGPIPPCTDEEIRYFFRLFTRSRQN